MLALNWQNCLLEDPLTSCWLQKFLSTSTHPASMLLCLIVGDRLSFHGIMVRLMQYFWLEILNKHGIYPGKKSCDRKNHPGTVKPKSLKTLWDLLGLCTVPRQRLQSSGKSCKNNRAIIKCRALFLVHMGPQKESCKPAERASYEALLISYALSHWLQQLLRRILKIKMHSLLCPCSCFMHAAP